jgi:hypothetical protein
VGTWVVVVVAGTSVVVVAVGVSLVVDGGSVDDGGLLAGA